MLGQPGGTLARLGANSSFVCLSNSHEGQTNSCFLCSPEGAAAEADLSELMFSVQSGWDLEGPPGTHALRMPMGGPMEYFHDWQTNSCFLCSLDVTWLGLLEFMGRECPWGRMEYFHPGPM